MHVSPIVLVLLVPVVVAWYFLWTFLLLLLRQARSPLRHLPGPPSPSFFMGNLREMHDQENNRLVARWVAAYGSTFVYRGFIGGCRLMTTDPRAINYIMSRGYNYPRPVFVRDALASMAGGEEGLITSDGDMHRKQRKILNKAFSAAQIKSLAPIFWDKALRLRNIWLEITTSPESFLTPVDPLAAPDASNSRRDADPEPAKSCTLSPSAITTSFLPNPFSSFVPSKASSTLPSTIKSRHAPSTFPEPSDVRCRLDVLPWLTRAALDVIGEAGFGYEFNSLEAAAQRRESESELARAFAVIFSAARKFRVMTIFQVWFPILRRYKRENAAMQQAHATMRTIGSELIEQRRSAVAAEATTLASEKTDVEGDRTVFDRDLLSVLIRSNISEVPTQRMSLNEILCQISTFIAAGHETSSSSLTWTLYALARSPSVQAKLRAELQSLPVPPGYLPLPKPPSSESSSHIFIPPPPSSPPLSPAPSSLPSLSSSSSGLSPSSSLTPSFPCAPGRCPPAPLDDATAALLERIPQLPYLDAVVRESLRLYAPVTTTMRVATADDVIPVAAPFVDRRGRTCAAIRVCKGDIISVPIQAMNKMEEAWGADAERFRPERWLGVDGGGGGGGGDGVRDDEDDGVGSGEDEKGDDDGEADGRRRRGVQGLWGNMLTFGGGNPVNGNRSCIGYRFALSEIKIFLFVLLRDLEFTIDPSLEIEKKVNVVTRPCVKSEPHRGNQMPLYIRRVHPPDPTSTSL